MDEHNQVRVTALYVYPIKSCGGSRVSSWPLSRNGLLFDREWVIVDESGRAVTQKNRPELSLVRASVDLTAQELIVTALYRSDLPTLVIPLGAEGDDGNGSIKVMICGNVRSGQRVSYNADEWFSSLLDDRFPSPASKRYRLVRKGRKSMDISNTERTNDVKDEITFSNKAPFLLISEESVRALVALIAAEEDASGLLKVANVRVENFRPNILVSVQIFGFRR
jgi:uncharacterized protein YcbX